MSARAARADNSPQKGGVSNAKTKARVGPGGESATARTRAEGSAVPVKAADSQGPASPTSGRQVTPPSIPVDTEFATRLANEAAPPMVRFRPYQQGVFMDRVSGILILHWSRQIGKSFTLASWAVDRLLTRPGRLVTVLSNSRDNGAEFVAKCAEVCNLMGLAKAKAAGVNLVLTNAGTVVTAASLNTSLFRIYSCIKVSDSLAEGYSYFYAEVRRLKALLDSLEQTNNLPLFFLIDEIFKGTNNRERLLGSEAYIHALLGKNGTGAISTHDLELASLSGLSNFHFADQVRDGQLTFDYKLRPGVSPTTNALRIMRLAGLPVGDV